MGLVGPGSRGGEGDPPLRFSAVWSSCEGRVVPSELCVEGLRAVEPSLSLSFAAGEKPMKTKIYINHMQNINKQHKTYRSSILNHYKFHSLHIYQLYR